MMMLRVRQILGVGKLLEAELHSDTMRNSAQQRRLGRFSIGR
jgi:hypothetical protein